MRAIFQAVTGWKAAPTSTAAPTASLDSGNPISCQENPHGMPFRRLLDPRKTKGAASEARQRGLVRIVAGMVKNQALPGADGQRQGATAVRDRALLFSDHPLAAYWLSVSHGGEPAWDEELARLRRAKAAIVQELPSELRLGMSDTGAVKGLMPLYRQWGAMLLDAGAAPGIDNLAADALAAWDAL